MHRIGLRAICLAIALAPALVWIPAGAQPPDPVAALLLRIGGAGARQAAFTEEKTLAALDGKLVSTGRLVYRPPGHLEKTTLQPHPESLVADGNQLTIQAEGTASRTMDLALQPEVRALVDTVRGTLSGDVRLLRFYYGITLAGPDTAWVLTMTPVAPQVARAVREVRVSGSGADPLVIETVQTNGDSTRLTIDPRK